MNIQNIHEIHVKHLDGDIVVTRPQSWRGGCIYLDEKEDGWRRGRFTICISAILNLLKRTADPNIIWDFIWDLITNEEVEAYLLGGVNQPEIKLKRSGIEAIIEDMLESKIWKKHITGLKNSMRDYESDSVLDEPIRTLAFKSFPPFVRQSQVKESETRDDIGREWLKKWESNNWLNYEKIICLWALVIATQFRYIQFLLGIENQKEWTFLEYREPGSHDPCPFFLPFHYFIDEKNFIIRQYLVRKQLKEVTAYHFINDKIIKKLKKSLEELKKHCNCFIIGLVLNGDTVDYFCKSPEEISDSNTADVFCVSLNNVKPYEKKNHYETITKKMIESEKPVSTLMFDKVPSSPTAFRNDFFDFLDIHIQNFRFILEDIQCQDVTKKYKPIVLGSRKNGYEKFDYSLFHNSKEEEVKVYQKIKSWILDESIGRKGLITLIYVLWKEKDKNFKYFVSYFLWKQKTIDNIIDFIKNTSRKFPKLVVDIINEFESLRSTYNKSSVIFSNINHEDYLIFPYMKDMIKNERNHFMKSQKKHDNIDWYSVVSKMFEPLPFMAPLLGPISELRKQIKDNDRDEKFNEMLLSNQKISEEVLIETTKSADLLENINFESAYIVSVLEEIRLSINENRLPVVTENIINLKLTDNFVFPTSILSITTLVDELYTIYGINPKSFLEFQDAFEGLKTCKVPLGGDYEENIAKLIPQLHNEDIETLLKAFQKLAKKRGKNSQILKFCVEFLKSKIQN